MKTVTLREFFHTPTLVRSLHPGQSLVVTSAGKADLIVTKAAPRPRKTAIEWQKEARALLNPKKTEKKVNAVEILRDLRK